MFVCLIHNYVYISVGHLMYKGCATYSQCTEIKPRISNIHLCTIYDLQYKSPAGHLCDVTCNNCMHVLVCTYVDLHFCVQEAIDNNCVLEICKE